MGNSRTKDVKNKHLHRIYYYDRNFGSYATRNVSCFRTLVSRYLIRSQLERARVPVRLNVLLLQQPRILVQICNYACNIMPLTAVNCFLRNRRRYREQYSQKHTLLFRVFSLLVYCVSFTRAFSETGIMIY